MSALVFQSNSHSLDKLLVIDSMTNDTKGFYDYPDMVTADPTKASVEYEDRDIRIVGFKLGAGETMPTHRHPGRIDLMITDVNAVTVQPNGTRRESHSTAGDSGYSDPVVHERHNIGGEPWEMVEIEFKQRAPDGFGTAWPQPAPGSPGPSGISPVPPLSYAKIFIRCFATSTLIT